MYQQIPEHLSLQRFSNFLTQILQINVNFNGTFLKISLQKADKNVVYYQILFICIFIAKIIHFKCLKIAVGTLAAYNSAIFINILTLNNIGYGIFHYMK